MVSIPEFLTTAPRHLFFTGKGGVGKTSLACASAVLLADKGRRVLLVSTDPASNLDAVLGTRLANSPTPVAGVPNLQAMNIDSEQATREYRERTVGPYRGILPPQEITLLEERLSGACTVEVAAFDEFALLLSDPDRTQEFDHVIFDTAPTGHTLRLLELPAAWTGFLESAPGDVSCLGPLSGLKTQRDRYARTVGALADPKLTAIMLVARPERVALIEAARTSAELRGQAMSNQLLIINGVFHATDRNDPLAAAFERRGVEALSHSPEELASLPRAEIPLIESQHRRIRRIEVIVHSVATSGCQRLPSRWLCHKTFHSLLILLMNLADPSMGSSWSWAREASERRPSLRLWPCRSQSVGCPCISQQQTRRSTSGRRSSPKWLGCASSYIDPKQEVRQYRERMLESARASLSAEKLALFEEELKSPCYEEVAVFQAFSRVVMGARKELVVIDTAPTGHTLLLLDTAGAYHRQLTQKTTVGPGRIRTPLMMLQDPEYTKILIVALPETTPVLEASSLQDDLRRAQIEPFAWVINGSLAAAQPRDPILRARAAAEISQIRKVKEQLAKRVVLIPFQAEEPVGVERLNSLAAGEAEHGAASGHPAVDSHA